MASNHLADLTDLEMQALRGRRYTPGYNGGQPFPYDSSDKESLPDSFDWRLYGAVTPVKGTVNTMITNNLFSKIELL